MVIFVVNSDGGGLVNFDVNNCTSTEGLDGRLSITVPLEVNWDWDDEPSTEALITVEDPLGVQVTAWETENFGLKVENDIQLDALQVTSEDGRSLYNGDFVREEKLVLYRTNSLPRFLFISASRSI